MLGRVMLLSRTSVWVWVWLIKMGSTGWVSLNHSTISISSQWRESRVWVVRLMAGYSTSMTKECSTK